MTSAVTGLLPCVTSLLVVSATMAKAQESHDSVLVLGRDAMLAASVDPPELLYTPKLHYPEHLQRARITGSVVFSFTLDTLGQVEVGSVRVRSASNPGFIDAAMEFLIHSRYRPARFKSPPASSPRAVRVRINQPINFRLRGRRG